MKRKPQLTPRLKAVAELIPPCRVFADIGTDHAYLPVYLCVDGICEKAIASDINEGPLERAGATVSEYGLNDKISLRLGGGLDTLEKDEADAVSIAGMGGLMIADILNSGKDKLKNAKQIVIQPMSSVPELRSLLFKNGFKIDAEYLSKEDKKLYHIMTVSLSDAETTAPSAFDLYIGKALVDTKPEYFDEYIKRKKTKLEAIINGMKDAKNKNSEKLEIAVSILDSLNKL